MANTPIIKQTQTLKDADDNFNRIREWAVKNAAGTTTTIINNTSVAAAPTGSPVTVVYPSGDKTGATDARNINSAIAGLLPTGGVVQLAYNVANSASFYINAPINIGNGNATTQTSTVNGIKLIGTGASGQFGTGVQIISKSPTYAIAINGLIRGWGIEDLNILTDTTASTAGIYCISAQGGFVRNVGVTLGGEHQTAIIESVYPTGATCSQNIWEGINIYLGNNYQTGVFMSSEGTGTATNTSYESYISLIVEVDGTKTGCIGLFLKMCDSNHFYMYNTYTTVYNSTYIAILFDYDSYQPGWPADNYFYSVHMGYAGGPSIGESSGYITSYGTPAGAQPNIIYGLGLTNGAIPPAVANLKIIGNDVIRIVLTPGQSFPLPVVPVQLDGRGATYYGAKGNIILNGATDYVDFYADSLGNVTLVGYTGSNFVANASTSGKICIGTSPASSPVIVTNNISGTTVNLMVKMDVL